MNKVIVTRAIVGIYAMQVCAVKEATDQEILDICNQENPSGTTNGWSRVIRSLNDVSGKSEEYDGKNQLPKECGQFADRLHLLVYC